MPFRDSQTHFRDILESIGNIAEFIGDMSLDTYQNDKKTKSAVERELQVISEAAIRLGDDAEILAPGPDWRGLRGMGNILRHGYHRIDDKIVWDTVKDDLPQLSQAVAAALQRE